MAARTRDRSKKFTRSEQQAAIKDFWNGSEIVEATEPLVIPFNTEDFEDGYRERPAFCVLACALKRVYKVKRSSIMQNVAYIKRTDKDGVDKVFRYSVQGAAKNFIVNFDKEGGEPRNGVVRLSAMKPSGTLKKQREYKARHKEVKNVRIVNSSRKPSKNGDTQNKKTKKPRNFSMPLAGVYTARDGRGHVHTTFDTPDD